MSRVEIRNTRVSLFVLGYLIWLFLRKTSLLQIYLINFHLADKKRTVSRIDPHEKSKSSSYELKYDSKWVEGKVKSKKSDISFEADIYELEDSNKISRIEARQFLK